MKFLVSELNQYTSPATSPFPGQPEEFRVGFRGAQMTPLLVESKDNHSLEALGLASVQIVHDLKNQLNGLKLYATFLRKRMEKTERPDDELDAIRKLIAGLNRTAEDLSMISEYGSPLHLKPQPGIDLQLIMAAVATSLNAHLDATGPKETGALADPVTIVSEPVPLVGEFDSAALAEALKAISSGALKMLNHKSGAGTLSIQLRHDSNGAGRDGLIEWQVVNAVEHDVFHSFAGSGAIRMALAARIIEAHGGTAECLGSTLQVRLPLTL